MGRYEHYKEIAVTNILNEMDREHVNNHDGRIDPSKTKENVILPSPNCEATTDGMRNYIHNRLESLGSQPKKTTSVLGQWIFTLPAEMKDEPKETKVEFFQMIYQKVQERYGPENVLPAFVHMDEPKAGDHIQIPIIPVASAGTRYKSTVYDKEATEKARAAGWKGKQKTKRIWKTYERDTLNNDAVMTKKELSAFHKDLDREILENHPEWAKFGMSEDGVWQGLLNNGRTAGDYTKEEFKQRKEDERKQREKDASLDEREAQISARDRRSQEILNEAEDRLDEASETLDAIDEMFDDAITPDRISETWMDAKQSIGGQVFTPRQLYNDWANRQKKPVTVQQKAVQSQTAAVKQQRTKFDEAMSMWEMTRREDEEKESDYGLDYGG